MSRTRVAAWLSGVVAATVTLGACSADSGGSVAPILSPAAEAGRETAKGAGCMSCHGGNGEGGVGPKWQGLAGTTVDLTDGSQVEADREYLIRAISEPGAQKVEGYAVAMPLANLTQAQVSSIVDYIEELS